MGVQGFIPWMWIPRSHQVLRELNQKRQICQYNKQILHSVGTTKYSIHIKASTHAHLLDLFPVSHRLQLKQALVREDFWLNLTSQLEVKTTE